MCNPHRSQLQLLIGWIHSWPINEHKSAPYVIAKCFLPGRSSLSVILIEVNYSYQSGGYTAGQLTSISQHPKKQLSFLFKAGRHYKCNPHRSQLQLPIGWIHSWPIDKHKSAPKEIAKFPLQCGRSLQIGWIHSWPIDEHKSAPINLEDTTPITWNTLMSPPMRT